MLLEMDSMVVSRWVVAFLPSASVSGLASLVE